MQRVDNAKESKNLNKKAKLKANRGHSISPGFAKQTSIPCSTADCNNFSAPVVVPAILI
jgi:hypothetical protein